jgi:hypothetical protein
VLEADSCLAGIILDCCPRVRTGVGVVGGLGAFRDRLVGPSGVGENPAFVRGNAVVDWEVNKGGGLCRGGFGDEDFLGDAWPLAEGVSRLGLIGAGELISREVGW